MPRRNRRKPIEIRSLPKDGSTFLGSQTVEGPSWTHGEPYVMRHIGSARAQKYYFALAVTKTFRPGWRTSSPGRGTWAARATIAGIGTATAGSVGRLAGMIVAFSVAPAVVNNDSQEMADAVSEAVRVVRESGLPNETNAMFTLLEGDWDEVFDTIKKATDAVRAVSPRTSLVVKADIREGVTNQLTDKVDAVNRRLAKED